MHLWRWEMRSLVRRVTEDRERLVSAASALRDLSDTEDVDVACLTHMMVGKGHQT